MIYQTRIDMVPIAKGRPRFSRSGRCWTPKGTRDAEKSILGHVLASEHPYWETEALTVGLVFYIPRPKSIKRDYPTSRPDLDNYVKLVLDSLNGILWKDDSQVISLAATKAYVTQGKEIPGIEILVSKL